MKYIICCADYENYVKSIDFYGAQTTENASEAKEFSDIDVADWVCKNMCNSTGGTHWYIFEIEE